MPRVYFAVPGDIDGRTGGTVYDRKVMAALREDGWRVEHLEWPGSFPFPNEVDRDVVEDSLAAVPDDALVMIDGLALGVLSGLARQHAQRLRLVAMVHHPLALESGLPEPAAVAFAASERDALACCRAVIVTSQTTGAIVEQAFGVPGEKITVATPGVDVAAQPKGETRTSGPVRLFAMGSISPRKGHDVLIASLGLIRDLDWTCALAGGLDRDPDLAADLKRQIAELGLRDRISLVGEVSEMEASALYHWADVFVLASLYEGYGMVFSEAMAFGLPIVGTTGGAIPEVVPPEAGRLVPPGDVQAFSEALRQVIADPALRAALAQGARRAAAHQTDWTHTAAVIADCLERL